MSPYLIIVPNATIDKSLQWPEVLLLPEEKPQPRTFHTCIQTVLRDVTGGVQAGSLYETVGEQLFHVSARGTVIRELITVLPVVAEAPFEYRR